MAVLDRIPQPPTHWPRTNAAPMLYAAANRLAAAACLYSVLLLLAVIPAHATVTVVNSNDSGAGSLRDAVANAAAGDTIIFDTNAAHTPHVTSPITLTGGEIAIGKNLTINGPGVTFLTINGNANGRIFHVTSGAVTISGLTMTNGTNAFGGAVESDASLTLSNCSITGSHSGNAMGQSGGGGIANTGAMTINSCTVSGNSNVTTSNGGGGIQNIGTLTITNSTISGNTSDLGGGIANYGTLSLTNSTIANNSAAAGGSAGGIDNTSDQGSATGNSAVAAVSLTNCTIANNTDSVSNSAGQILSGYYQGAGNAVTTLKNTILMGTSGQNAVTNGGQRIISLGNNISSDGTGNLVQPTDHPNTNPMLGTLASNGGPTQTMALLPASPAIDAGDNAAVGSPLLVLTDQRGANRPQGPFVDIGASELASGTDIGVTLNAPSSVPPGATVTYTVTVTNHGPANATGVTFVDRLPAGATFMGANFSQGSVSVNVGTATVTVSIGAIANGASVTGTVTVTSNTVGPLYNTASVFHATEDPAFGNNTFTATTTITDPAVTATGGFTVPAVQNIAFSNQVVAAFTDPEGVSPVSAYSATISWGDNTASPGLITLNSSTRVFTVLGSHTYTVNGTYPIAVTIQHAASPASTVASTAVVSNPWKISDLATGSDGRVRLLWNHFDGVMTLWNVDTSNAVAPGPTSGPYPGFAATAVAAGADGLTRVLWTQPGGVAALWLLSASNAYQASFGFGPYTGWTARDITVGSDGQTKILWVHSDNAIALWSVDNNGHTGPPSMYGPVAGLTAKAIAADGAGNTWLLWNDPSGATQVWLLDNTNTMKASFGVATPAGFTAQDIAIDGSGNARILSTNSSGQMSLVTVTFNPSSGGVVSHSTAYGPYPGFTTAHLAAGPGSYAWVLWNNVNGAQVLFLFNGNNVYAAGLSYGPY